MAFNSVWSSVSDGQVCNGGRSDKSHLEVSGGYDRNLGKTNEFLHKQEDSYDSHDKLRVDVSSILDFLNHLN